jgi:UDP-3-O-[3-hydroxymyristoyl] glucosamine N-acyltransferase
MLEMGTDATLRSNINMGNYVVIGSMIGSNSITGANAVIGANVTLSTCVTVKSDGVIPDNTMISNGSPNKELENIIELSKSLTN